MTKAPFIKKGTRTNDLLELIHTDVCGSISTLCKRCLLDDHSRYNYVYLMRHKSESFDKFKEFKNKLNKKIKALHSDQGGVYLSHEFGDYLMKCGIVSQLTPPGMPQWNDVSERRNRTLLNMVRSMMSQSDLPTFF
jgi:transposase InsO family protein